MSRAAAHKQLELFLWGSIRSLVGVGVYYLLMSLLAIGTGLSFGFNYMFFMIITISSVLIVGNFFMSRSQLHEIPPNNQENAIEKTYTEFKLISIFILLINLTVFFLYLLPFFVIEFDVINFTQPFAILITWFYLCEGIFLCILSYLLNSRKRKILSTVKIQKMPHEFFEPNEAQRAELTTELTTQEIIPEGTILMVFEQVGYSDPTYAVKRIRKWPWRERGKMLLTEKELIFLGKKAKFVIPLSEIKSIQPFTARGGLRELKVCEIVYGSSKKSVILYGNVNFRWASDPPTEVELKSMRLMEAIQKWYNVWVQN